MDQEELEGVLAHELSHVTNRDILISSVAATIAGAISMLAHMAQYALIFGGFGGRDDRERSNPLGLLVTIIVAPIAAMLIQLAISRSREYQADQSGAELTGNPYGLARALEKLGQASRRIPMDANPATSHLFIVSPFSRRAFVSLFSTHPPLQERNRRLTGRPAARRGREVRGACRQAQLEQDEFRKRLARDVERRADAEVANSLQALLDVADGLERPLRHADEGLTGGESPAFQGLLEGVRLVRDRFLSVLREPGVGRLEVAGDRFDPEKAEAVRTVEVKDETRDGIVLEEIQPGYLYKGHLLRPARVAVGRL